MGNSALPGVTASVVLVLAQKARQWMDLLSGFRDDVFANGQFYSYEDATE